LNEDGKGRRSEEMKVWAIISVTALMLLSGCATPQQNQISVYEAIIQKDEEAVRRWARKAKDINQRWNMDVDWIFSATPLQLAAAYGTVPICETLLRKGAKMEPEDEFGTKASALSIACGKRRLEIAKFLIERGAKLDHQDEKGTTALMHTSASGGSHAHNSEDIQAPYDTVAEPFVRLLLSKKANPLIKDNIGLIARDHASQFKFWKVVRLLDAAAAKRD
jgi:ankyrin repeat protein